VGEHSCASLGYYNALGELRCNPDCTWDDSSCGGRCGDGQVQEGGGEACDGGNLNGQTCQSLGYTGGTLVCDPATCRFDFSGCAGACGDGVIQAASGEACDSAALAGETCESQGHYAGTLSCGADCQLVTTGCGGHCGDGVAQTTFGEDCDVVDLQS